MVLGAFFTVLFLPRFSSMDRMAFSRVCGLIAVSICSTWLRKSAWSVFPQGAVSYKEETCKSLTANKFYICRAPAAYEGICLLHYHPSADKLCSWMNHLIRFKYL